MVKCWVNCVLGDHPVDPGITCITCKKPRHLQCMKEQFLEDDSNLGYCAVCQDKDEGEGLAYKEDSAYPLRDGASSLDSRKRPAISSASSLLRPSAVGTDKSKRPTETESRPKKARGAGSANAELYKHFIDTGEKNKNSNHALIQCRYCVEYYAAQLRQIEASSRMLSDSQKVIQMARASVKEPKKFNKAKDRCESHLGKCSHALKAMRNQKSITADESTSTSSITSMTTVFDDTPVNQRKAAPFHAMAPSFSHSTPMSGRQLSMDAFVVPLMTPREAGEAKEFLTECIVSLALPYSLVDHAAFKRFIDSVRPGASKLLSDRKFYSANVKSKGLEARRRNGEEVVALAERGYYIGLATDGWQNINRRHLDAVVLTAGDKVFLESTVPSGTDHTAPAVLKGWEALLEEIHEEGTFTITSICTDSAGQCAKARRGLVYRRPHMMVMPCFAHIVDPILKHTMKSSDFGATVDLFSVTASTIVASSSKWLPRLERTMMEMYGKTYKIFTVATTRWNSLQACLASQLRVKDACKVFVSTYSQNPSFPRGLLAWGDESHWIELSHAECLARPLCEASFLMQRNGNTMAHVMLMFLNMANHLISFTNGAEKALLADIQSRWNGLENTLFFLAFILHPQYRQTAVSIVTHLRRTKGNWSINKNPFQWSAWHSL